MKVSIKILIVITVLITAIIFIINNTGDNSVMSQKETFVKLRLSLIKADEDFYRSSLINGTGRAFINFADTDVVIMRENSRALIGKKALQESYLNKDTLKTPLKWNPVKAEVSPDGKLGYTFGNWEYKTKDGTGKIVESHGNYITIWRRQNDGTWKYVFDGGSTLPSHD